MTGQTSELKVEAGPGAFRAMSLAKYGAVCNIPREQRFQASELESRCAFISNSKRKFGGQVGLLIFSV